MIIIFKLDQSTMNTPTLQLPLLSHAGGLPLSGGAPPRLHHQPAGPPRAAAGVEGGDGRVQPGAGQISVRPHCMQHAP